MTPLRSLVRRILGPAIAAAMPLNLPAADTVPPPAWEIHLRLDHEGPALCRDGLREILGGRIDTRGIGPVDLCIMGFDMQPGGIPPWMAEVRGLPGIEAVVGGENAVSHAPVPFDREGIRGVIWSDRPGMLRCASPADSARRPLPDPRPLPKDCWLAGWLDLRRLPAGMPASSTLRAADQAEFRVGGSGDHMSLELRLSLHDQHLAESSRAMIEELRGLMRKRGDAAGTRLNWESELHGSEWLVRVHFTEQDATRILGELRRQAETPAPGPPAPARQP